MGYSAALTGDAVAAVQDVPVHLCTVQHMKERLRPIQDGELLKVRVAAAGLGRPGGIGSMVRKLENEKATIRLVEEADEEESRTVEMYDRVMTAVVTRGGKRTKARQQRPEPDSDYSSEGEGDREAQPEAEPVAVKAELVEATEDEKCSEVVRAKEKEATESAAPVQSKEGTGELAMKEAVEHARVSVEALDSMQDTHPHMKQLKQYP